MAQLRQRVFMIMIRPCFVKSGPGPGYPNVVTKYIGEMYRSPIGSEAAPAVAGTPAPAGYKACIKLPALNASLLGTGDNAVIGGGIERFYDNTGKGRMPADKPAQTDIDLKKTEVEEKHEELQEAQEALKDDATNPTLIAAVEAAQEALELAMHELNVMQTGASMFSKPPFNENQWFSNDYWVLHSTWTSFDECKNYVRFLIDLLGFDGIMISNYIELDMEILPNK